MPKVLHYNAPDIYEMIVYKNPEIIEYVKK